MFLTGQIAPYWFYSITNRLLFLLSLYRCRRRRQSSSVRKNTRMKTTSQLIVFCMQQTLHKLPILKIFRLSVLFRFIFLRHSLDRPLRNVYVYMYLCNLKTHAPLTFYCKPIELKNRVWCGWGKKGIVYVFQCMNISYARLCVCVCACAQRFGSRPITIVFTRPIFVSFQRMRSLSLTNIFSKTHSFRYTFHFI